ncbi:MAG: membrane dipeptidase [Gemmatimonadetes bacterium]|nr:MAG: membrane dipeptidase [Gemmatimonadota bacterium]
MKAVRQFVGWSGSLTAVLLLSAYPPDRLAAQDYRAQALRILKTVPLIDGHNDIPDAVRGRGGLDSVDFAASQPKLMTDIPRLRAGGVGGQFWSAYVPVTTIHGGEHPAVYALEQIDLVHRLCRKYPQTFAEAATAAAVERNFKAGKISCLIGIEGGHAIENSLGALRMFARLGVRYMTLTHWETLDWADAATDSAKHNGLTPFGEEVVREMNRVGMLVDLAHVSDATMVGAIRVSRAPVLFSHSSARALCDHVRNVPDSILRMVKANGGVVMVNFYPTFVSEAVRAYGDSVTARSRALRAAGADSALIADTVRSRETSGPKATLSQVADHIEHIRDVAGVDHVGLGSDFDGITTVPVGLEDVSKFPDLLAELLRRGWSEQDVRKVAGLNVLRVLRDAERVSREMSAARD